jgi:hypothetical protein
MSLFVTIEASQPHGATYRLAIGCTLPLALVSVLAAIARFF